VSFTRLPLYLLGNSPMYPLDKRLGGPQSRSGRSGKEKSLASCRESNPDRPARRPSLYRLLGEGGKTIPRVIRILSFSVVNTETHHWRFLTLFKFVLQSVFNRGKLIL
jgi:hypothetical protein